MKIQEYISKFPNIRDANNHLRHRFGLRIKKDKLVFMDTIQKDEEVFIYNAHEKDSPRCSPLVKEANGLILDTVGNVVSRSIDKVYEFNDPCNTVMMDWETVRAMVKYGGRLVTLFNHREEWFIQDKWNADLADTDIEMDGSPGVNIGMAVNALITDATKLENPYKHLSHKHSYAFQLVQYKSEIGNARYGARLILLSIYDKGLEEFLPPWIVDDFATNFGFKRPATLLDGRIFYKEALSKLDMFNGTFVLIDEYGSLSKYSTKSKG